jgi:hypothetical protein
MLVTGYVLGKNLLERDEAVKTLEAGFIDAGCSGKFLEMIFFALFLGDEEERSSSSVYLSTDHFYFFCLDFLFLLVDSSSSL